MKIKYLTGLAATLLAAACTTAGPGLYPGTRVGPPPIDYVALVGHPDRPAADMADDEARQPAAVLAFAGAGYGMTVIDMESGGGYYAELLSRAVGEDGRVYMQNPAQFDGFLGDSVTQRLADGRLSNVISVRTPFDDLEVEAGTVDLVTWVLGPHELWFEIDPENPAVLGDPYGTFFEIARVLKPGGAFVALDHRAVPGTPTSSGNDTHRIDPAIIIERAGEAGLELVAESDLFANPDDTLELNVFDPAIRRKTDRFLLRFEKPAD